MIGLSQCCSRRKTFPYKFVATTILQQTISQCSDVDQYPRFVCKIVAGACRATCWRSLQMFEHLETDRASHIFKHLETSPACRSACSRDNFAIIDQASTRFALKIKEALHIVWEKPTLNAQVKHVNLKLSV